MGMEVITDADFQSKIDGNSKVVVKYYADWCGSCRLFKPKYRRMSEDAKYGDLTFLYVNAEESPAARKLAGVTNLPFFAAFRDGALVEGIATNKEEAVVALIEKLN